MPTLEEAIAPVEDRVINEALRRTAGHRKAAAKLLGISSATLYRKIEMMERRSNGHNGVTPLPDEDSHD